MDLIERLCQPTKAAQWLTSPEVTALLKSWKEESDE